MSIGRIGEFEDFLYKDIEDRLSPIKGESTFSRFSKITVAFIEIPIALITTIVHQCIQNLVRLTKIFTKSPSAKEDFSVVVEDPRKWSEIDVDHEIMQRLQLGHANSNFKWGTGTCNYQSDPENFREAQWHSWEPPLESSDLERPLPQLYRSYTTPEGRQELIRQLQDLGVNTFRFSISLPKTMLPDGGCNEEEFAVIIALCKDLRDAGIAPVVTLHHFAEEQKWHNQGSFATKENAQKFVNFAVNHAIPALCQDYMGEMLVERIYTINEPNVEAFSRYLRGAFSPGVYFDFEKAFHFLMNMYEAHNEIYRLAKQQFPEAKIGLTYQYLVFKSANPLTYPVTSYLTEFVNNVSMRYFAASKDSDEDTVETSFKAPGLVNLKRKTKKFQADFMGVQVYVRPFIGVTGSIPPYNGIVYRITRLVRALFGWKNEVPVMTSMPFWEDPAAVFPAIVSMFKALGIKLHLSELGICPKDEKQRARFLRRVLYAAQEAAKEIGEENFEGAILWSMRTWEWNDPHNKWHGFSTFDENGQVKTGAAPFKEAIASWKEQFPAARAAAG